MSFKYTKSVWSFSFKGKNKAIKKLIMLNLADRAGEDGLCFPSIAKIAEDTLLDRRTIMTAISSLIEEGLLEDTKMRKGQTKQVRVLRILIDVVEDNKALSEPRSKKKDDSGTVVTHTSKTSPQRAKTGIKKGAVAHSYGNVKSMKECFEEGSDNKNADRSLTLSERIALMKGEKIDLNKRNEALEQGLDESGTNVPENTKTVSTELTDSLNEMCNGNEEDEYLNNLSQQAYDECDLAMLNALNKQQEHLTDDKLTVGQLLGNIGSVYKSGVSEDRERIYRMTKLQSSYLEDY